MIIFDEIQECSDALTSLKYFQEGPTNYSIIAAGSLLGLTLGKDRSFPVGKVDFLDLYPLTFTEFLKSADEKNYQAFLHFLDFNELKKIPDTFFTPIMNHFKTYIISGGMPEVAKKLVTTNDIKKCQKIQDQILRAYQLDFAKHAKGSMSTRIQYVWDSLPSQLAKENKKFLYNVVKKGARAREYEDAITWLQQAGLISKVFRINKPALPLSAYRDLSNFKVYMLDSGLLMRMARLDPRDYIAGSSLFQEFKGAIIENYIAQCFTTQYGHTPTYWASDGTAEVDFIVQQDSAVFPIEVKSGTTSKSKSLTVYKNKYKPKLRIRLSPLNLTLDDDLINIPLFYADHIVALVNKVREN